MSTAIQGNRGSRKSGPPKLRSACNQCNSAKVKCTGQRDGCNRCQSLGLECIYVESRVGKVPGTRAKKLRQQSESISVDESNESKSPQQPTYRHAPSNSHHSQDEQTEWNLEQHLNDDLMDFGNIGSLFADQNELLNMQLSAPRSLNNEPRLTNLDFNDEILFSPDGQNNHTMMSLTYAPTNTYSPITNGKMNSTNKPDSHCIFACTQIIDHLERYICNELTTLDTVLDIVKENLGSLEGLINLPTTALTFSSKALFSVIITQTVSLLEDGYRKFRTEKSPPNQHVNGDSWITSQVKPLPIFPIFGFETFEIDTDEQRMWSSQAILKELLYRSLEVLRKIAVLMQNDLDLGCCPPSWSEELSGRITALCDVLKDEK